MKLKKPNDAPVGGWKFSYPVEKCARFPEGIFRYSNNSATDVSNFTRLVNTAMIQNGVSVPDGLREIVEDYICTYQPPDRCIYSKKLGDQLSRIIHSAAAVADVVTGNKFKIQKKARGCQSCGQRRNKLNR